jgi:hypothetical protein
LDRLNVQDYHNVNCRKCSPRLKVNSQLPLKEVITEVKAGKPSREGDLQWFKDRIRKQGTTVTEVAQRMELAKAG